MGKYDGEFETQMNMLWLTLREASCAGCSHTAELKELIVMWPNELAYSATSKSILEDRNSLLRARVC